MDWKLFSIALQFKRFPWFSYYSAAIFMLSVTFNILFLNPDYNFTFLIFSNFIINYNTMKVNSI